MVRITKIRVSSSPFTVSLFSCGAKSAHNLLFSLMLPIESAPWIHTLPQQSHLPHKQPRISPAADTLAQTILTHHSAPGGQLHTLLDGSCRPGTATHSFAPYFA